MNYTLYLNGDKPSPKLMSENIMQKKYFLYHLQSIYNCVKHLDIVSLLAAIKCSLMKVLMLKFGKS